MIDEGYHAYFRLEGARALLMPFSRELPVRRERWEPEVDRMTRAACAGERRNGRTLSEVAGQLLSAASEFEASGGGRTRATKGIPVADPPGETARVLREIAAYVEDWRPVDHLPTAPDFGFWELRQRFPRLAQILPIYFGTNGIAWEDDDRTTEEGMTLVVDQTHPHCLWDLVDVVTELHEAMALFHDEQSCVNFFENTGWSSGDLDWLEFFPLLATTITDHLRTHHAQPWPAPQPKG